MFKFSDKSLCAPHPVSQQCPQRFTAIPFDFSCVFEYPSESLPGTSLESIAVCMY